MKIKFIKSKLDSLPFTNSKDKRTTYHDSQTPYLVLRISHNRKSFYYYRKLKHTKSPIKDKIGDYPDISIRQAQDQVKQINTKIISGSYFHKSDMLFKELFEKYYLLYSKKYKRLYMDDRRKFDVYLRHFHNTPCNQLTVKEANELHAKIGSDNGPYMANRVIALVRGIFNWGLRQQLIKCENPARSIKKFAEKSRDRFMDVEEFKRFFEALDSPDTNENMRDYFKILVFTGARKSNVMSMRWEDIRFDNKTWTIPGEFYKNGNPFTAVLVDYVMEILERRKKNTSDSKYVFPSPTSISGHMEDPKKAWVSILKKAKINNLRIHDLRRTLGSWQAIGGSSLLVIGESLGQKTTQATEVYARLNKNVVRESVNNATSAMLRVITEVPDKSSNSHSDVDKLKGIINGIQAKTIREFKKMVMEEILRK